MTSALLVSTQFPPYNIGGDATIAYYEALGLVEKGLQVNVLCDDRIYVLLSGQKFKKISLMPLRDNFHVFSCKSNFPVQADIGLGYLLHYNPAATKQFRVILSQNKPDFIHFHTYTFFGSTLLSDANRYNRPVLYTLHDFWPLCPTFNYITVDSAICKNDCMKNPVKCIVCSIRKKRPIQLRPNHWWLDIFKKIDAIIVSSDYLKYSLAACGLDISRIVKLPWPLATDHMTILETELEAFKQKYRLENKKIVLYVGKMNQIKGIQILIKAFQRKFSNNSNVVLMLVGTGPDLEYFKILARKSKNIVFTGRLYDSEYAAAFKACDVFVLPSIYPEFFSIVTHEAMFAQKPVIVSNIGAMSEFVREGFNGLLVEPNNSESLSDAIYCLITDSVLREKMGSNGKQLVQQYTIQNHTKQIIEIVNSINRRY